MLPLIFDEHLSATILSMVARQIHASGAGVVLMILQSVRNNNEVVGWPYGGGGIRVVGREEDCPACWSLRSRSRSSSRTFVPVW